MKHWIAEQTKKQTLIPTHAHRIIFPNQFGIVG